MGDPFPGYEASYQVYLHHIRFWETREGEQPQDEALIRDRYEEMCSRAGRRAEETRRQAGYLEPTQPATKGMVKNPTRLPRWPGPVSPSRKRAEGAKPLQASPHRQKGSVEL